MKTQISTAIDKAIAFLNNNELVGIPTETVYGLAGNALNEDAVLKIFAVKNRPSFDPLIVHVPDADAVMHYVNDIPLKAAALMEAFWPGPLTILLKKKSVIPDIVTSGLDTVAIRMPAHPLTLQLLQELKFPLAAPSANPFGYVSPTNAQHVKDQLDTKIPYILDGGACSVGVESTIVGFDDDRCIVYRLGGLTVEHIRKVAGEVNLQINSSSDPKAPGMLKSHYAPRKPLFLGNINELLEEHKGKKIAVISFDAKNIKTENLICLSEDGNLEQAARNLFAALRNADKMNVDIVIAEKVPDMGIGKAINDRLTRAAYH